jgi:hypothetical protein
MTLQNQIKQEQKADRNSLLGAALFILLIAVFIWFYGIDHDYQKNQKPEVAGISSGVSEMRK